MQPSAETARAQLQAACAQAGLGEAPWRAALGSFVKGYVKAAEDLRRGIGLDRVVDMGERQRTLDGAEIGFHAVDVV